MIHLPPSDLLRARVTGPSPTLVLLAGPARSGKSVMLRQALGVRAGALHWEVSPLEGAGLLGELDRLVAATLGELPAVERPDLLPLPGSGHAWALRFEGVLRGVARAAAEAGDSSGVLVVDGMDALTGAGRGAVEALAEAWSRTRGTGVPAHLVLTFRGEPPASWIEAAPGGEVLVPGPVPFRVAARAHQAGWGEAARDPLGALACWAVFGERPGRLPSWRSSPAIARGASWGEALEAAVVERVLVPGGDLHDAPLRDLEADFQVPRRYLGIVTAMASGEAEWGGIAVRVGAEAGNRMAPYLRSLETGGWIQVRTPLDGAPGGRRRRYALVDPFDDFWFSRVLPVRSLLHRQDPHIVYREQLAPALGAHLGRWLPELARRWLAAYAREALPAEAREVGALWAGPAEVEVAARLANGQVCYGVCTGSPGGLTPETAPAPGTERDPDSALMDRLEASMAETRWGIGREARAPLVFLLGPPSEALRRRVARTGLGRILTPAELMAEPPSTG